MARNSAKQDGRSKIRFVLLEAEIDGGDFSEITQAIRGAFGPKTIVYNTLEQTREELPGGGGEGFDVLEHLNEDEDSEPGRPKKARTPARRSFPTPEVVDVDWGVSPSIEEYVAQHPPQKEVEKYLVIISWFKEVVKIDAVSANQIYTVFRKLKWSVAKKDFSQPLRDLKSSQLIKGSAKDGFMVNQLGIARVEELG